MDSEKREEIREAVKRRLVRIGERFNSDELARGELEFEEVSPAPEIPEDEQVEPWALLAEFREKHEHHGLFHRLREYRKHHKEADDGDQ